MNYKVKQAVTTAISLIAIGFHQASHAIGLGDIEIHSTLGEPLKASVNVMGADQLRSPSCLTLGDHNTISNVNLRLGPVSNGSARLLLSSNQVINEPIINLSVIAGCENSVQREYVLLLDPPLIGQNSIENTTPVSSTETVQEADTNVKASTTNQTNISSDKPINTPKASTKKTKPRVAKKSSVKRNQRQQASKNQPSQSRKQQQPTKTAKKQMAPEARLTITGSSGGNYNQMMALRLDRTLTFKPDPNATAVNDIALEDEVTVMNNRLAHLQEQITALEEKNQKLLTVNQSQAAQLTKVQAETSFNFWPIIGAGLLLISGYAAYSLVRRRQLENQLENAPYLWTDTDSRDEPTTAITAEDHEESASTKEALFEKTESAAENNDAETADNSAFDTDAANESTILVEDEQEFSVLDHADVFLSHGRSSLAIQLLQNHLLEFPKQSVTIWLFLLDLLAKEDLKSLYEETALDCRLHFNVQIPEFSTETTNSNESLEDFPRLAKGLEDVWDTPAALNYLDDLIYNNRLEPRAGLPKNLIEELLILRAIAQENNNSADVIELDQKKLAMIEQKEALLESRKRDKLKEIADAEMAEKERKEAELAEEKETDFEFTLVENNH